MHKIRIIQLYSTLNEVSTFYVCIYQTNRIYVGTLSQKYLYETTRCNQYVMIMFLTNRFENILKILISILSYRRSLEGSTSTLDGSAKQRKMIVFLICAVYCIYSVINWT